MPPHAPPSAGVGGAGTLVRLYREAGDVAPAVLRAPESQPEPGDVYARWLQSVHPEDVGPEGEHSLYLTGWYKRALREMDGRPSKVFSLGGHKVSLAAVCRELPLFLTSPVAVLQGLVLANTLLIAEATQARRFLQWVHSEVGSDEETALIFVVTAACLFWTRWVQDRPADAPRRTLFSHRIGEALKGNAHMLAADVHARPLLLCHRQDTDRCYILQAVERAEQPTPGSAEGRDAIQRYQESYRKLNKYVVVSAEDVASEFVLTCLDSNKKEVKLLQNITHLVSSASLSYPAIPYGGETFYEYASKHLSRGSSSISYEGNAVQTSAPHGGQKREKGTERLKCKWLCQGGSLTIYGGGEAKHVTVEHVLEKWVRESSGGRYLAWVSRKNEVVLFDAIEEKTVLKLERVGWVCLMEFHAIAGTDSEEEHLIVCTKTSLHAYNLAGQEVLDCPTDLFGDEGCITLTEGTIRNSAHPELLAFLNRDGVVFQNKARPEPVHSTLMPGVAAIDRSGVEDFNLGPYTFKVIARRMVHTVLFKGINLQSVEGLVRFAGISEEASRLFMCTSRSIHVYQGEVLIYEKNLEAGICALSISQDGSLAACALDDGLLKIMDIERGRIYTSLSSQGLKLMYFLNDRSLALAGADRFVCKQVTNAGGLLGFFMQSPFASEPGVYSVGPNSLRFTEDATSTSHTILLSNNKLERIESQGDTTRTFNFNEHVHLYPKDRAICDRILEEHNILIDTGNLQLVGLFESLHMLIVVLGGKLHVLDLERRHILYNGTVGEDVCSLVASRTGTLLACSTRSNRLLLISLEKGTLLREIRICERIVRFWFQEDDFENTHVLCMTAHLAHLMDATGRVLDTVKIPTVDVQKPISLEFNGATYRSWPDGLICVLSVTNNKLRQRVDNNPKDPRRAYAKLPILEAKDAFLKRLKDERVLIVTTETGSGKTTQLAQYCADSDEYDGLVLVTQPRALAAVSLASRVAFEYDGHSDPASLVDGSGKPGNNVGYIVRGKSVRGSRILFLTDSTLIDFYRAGQLKHVSVLIIDEVHERSMNTDIAMGLAHRLLQERKDDFRVVISSATINPGPFQEYFKDVCNIGNILKVEGKRHKIDVEYRPAREDESKEQHLNNVLVEALNMHKQGDCLVFLPGEGDVQRAMHNFKQYAPDNCVLLPLHDQLEPEEQMKVFKEDFQGKERKIIFATNMAETSITIPGCKLVVDTGLFEESEYDSERRVTHVVERAISKSSAEQRKGRAGRVSDGTCIRLYSEEEYINFSEGSTPEILRSSLDNVVLRFLDIGIAPEEFNFITALEYGKPEMSMLENSRDNLKSMNYLTQDGDVTNKGKLCCSVSMDTRLFHFITCCCELGDHFQSAVAVGALLSAPGSIFVPVRRDRKDEATLERLERAKAMQSDIEFMLAEFMSYKDALKTGSRFEGARYLNKKILKLVLQLDSQYTKSLVNSRFLGAVHSYHSFSEALGVALADAYPEHIAQILVPKDPPMGIYMLSSPDEAVEVRKSFIDPNSVLAFNPTGTVEYCVGLDLFTKDGTTFMSNCTPLNMKVVGERHESIKQRIRNKIELVNAYEEYNIGDQLYNEFLVRCKQDTILSSILITHSLKGAVMRVSSLQRDREVVRRKLKDIMSEIREKFISETMDMRIEDGDVFVTFSSGLQFVDVSERGAFIPIRLYTNKCELDQLEQYVRGELGTEDQKLIERVEGYKSGSGQVVMLSRAGEEDMNRLDGKIHRMFSDEYSPAEFKANIETEEDLNQFMSLNLNKVALRIHSSNNDFKKMVAYSGVQFSGDACLLPSVSHQKAKDVLSACQKAAQELQQKQSQTLQHPDSPIYNMKLVANIDTSYQPDASGQLEFESKLGTLKPIFEVSFPTVRLDTFKDSENIKANIEKNIPEIKIYVSEGKDRITIVGSKYCSVLRAAKDFKSLVSPSFMRFYDEDVIFYNDLKDSGLLAKWSHEYEVHTEEAPLRSKTGHKCGTKLALYGEQVGIMGYIKELINQRGLLHKSMHVYNVPQDRCYLLEDQWKIASLEKKYQGQNSCVVIIKGPLPKVIVYRKIKDEETGRMLFHTIDRKVQKSLYGQAKASRAVCPKCRAELFKRFTICGHPLCTECLRAQLKNPAKSIHCHLCKTPVYLRDIQEALPEEELAKSIHSRLDIQISMYPNLYPHLYMCNNCGFLQQVRRDSMNHFIMCRRCSEGYCPVCRTKDPLHKYMTCDAFRTKEGEAEELEELFTSAEQFARSNWHSSVPPMSGFFPNRSLASGSPSMQRFSLATEIERVADIFSCGFFAWHGSRAEAMKPICFEGFDPGRRSGQAYGAGEYFAPAGKLTVSYGYSRNAPSGCVIVAFILQKGVTVDLAKSGGYCYVIGNNPLSWEYSYCLPVGLATWGNWTPEPFSLLDPPRNILFYSQRSLVMHVEQKYVTKYTQWKWEYPEGEALGYAKYMSYKDEDNTKIEWAYRAYKAGGESNARFVLHGVRRYKDNRKCAYELDFKEMKQRNPETRKERPIRRDLIEVPFQEGYDWQYKEQNGLWVRMDAVLQALMEKLFLAYSRDESIAGEKLVLAAEDSPVRYGIDFSKQELRNLSTNATHLFRRVCRRNIVTWSTISYTFSGTVPALDDLRACVSNQLGRIPSMEILEEAMQFELKGRNVLSIRLGGSLRTLSTIISTMAEDYFRGKGLKYELNEADKNSTRLNPRLREVLRKITSDNVRMPRTRNDVLIILVRYMVHDLGLTIYGGFIRDWIIREVEASDIDAQIKTGEDPATIAARLIEQMKKYGVTCTKHCMNIYAYKVFFNFNGSTLNVDLVDGDKLIRDGKSNEPHMDADVNNFILNHDGLSLKRQIRGLSFEKCYRHCEKGVFVFLLRYDTDPGVYSFRVKKLFAKNFVCISDIDNRCGDRQLNLEKIKPKKKYQDKRWEREGKL